MQGNLSTNVDGTIMINQDIVTMWQYDNDDEIYKWKAMTYFLDIRYVTKYDESCQRVTNNIQSLYNELEMLIFDGIKKHRKGL